MNTINEIAQCVSDIQTQLLTQYDRLERQTKSALEEFTLLKTKINDQTAALSTLQRAQVALRNEQLNASGDPIRRIVVDEQKRNYLNGAIRYLCSAPLSEPQKKALGEDTLPGSALIAGDLANDIYDLLATYGQWSTLGVRRLSSKTTTFPVKTARTEASWVITEGSQIQQDTNISGTSVDLTVKLMAVLINVSRQLIEDSDFDITANILQDLAEACAKRLDYAAFVATGANNAESGGFTGIFSGGTPLSAASGHTTVETLTFDDVVSCLTVNPELLNRKPKWWIHPSMFVRLLHIKDLNGRPIFLSAIEAPSPGAIGSILGYPVVLCNIAPADNSAGKPVAVFGDPQGCIVGIRNDFEFAASDHHAWDYYQRSFRGILRAGVRIRDQGAFVVLKTAAA